MPKQQMKRRLFLSGAGALLSSTVPLWPLAGCGGKLSAVTDDLPAGWDGPAGMAVKEPGPAPANWATGAYKFPQSVASGDPRPDSLILWARVVPATADDVLAATGVGDFKVKLLITASNNADRVGSTQVLQGTDIRTVDVSVYEAHDHAARVKLDGLQPGTRYFYQFVAGDSRSRIGQARTAAASGDSQINFATLTGLNWNSQHWSGMDALVGEQLDFVLVLGNYIHEVVESFADQPRESAHTAFSLPRGTVLDEGRYAATSLEDYRTIYKKYRTDPRLQKLHERFAFINLWGAHEFSGASWQDHATYDAANTAQPERKLAADQAWYEYVPADVLSVDGKVSGIWKYRKFAFGNLLELIALDQRTYRTDHMIPEPIMATLTGQADGANGVRHFVDAAANAQFAKQRQTSGGLDAVTMLGAQQRNWLKGSVMRSDKQWKIIAGESALMQMGFDGSKLSIPEEALKAKFVLSADQWDGYVAERSDIVGYFAEKNVKNIVSVAGGFGGFLAGEVHRDFDAPAATGVLTELVTGNLSDFSACEHYTRNVTNTGSFSPASILFEVTELGCETAATVLLSTGLNIVMGKDPSDSLLLNETTANALAAGLITAGDLKLHTDTDTALVPKNTLDEMLCGQMGEVVANTIWGLSSLPDGPARAYRQVVSRIAASVKQTTDLKASDLMPFFNPFLNFSTLQAPPKANPWIRWSKTSARGYSVMTVTRDGVACTFKKFDDISSSLAAGSAKASVLSVTVAAGNPQPQLAKTSGGEEIREWMSA